MGDQEEAAKAAVFVKRKELDVYWWNRTASACGEFNNPQTWPASPEPVIPFECERSRASYQMGAAAIACTFDGESVTVLAQRQPT